MTTDQLIRRLEQTTRAQRAVELVAVLLLITVLTLGAIVAYSLIDKNTENIGRLSKRLGSTEVEAREAKAQAELFRRELERQGIAIPTTTVVPAPQGPATTGQRFTATTVRRTTATTRRPPSPALPAPATTLVSGPPSPTTTLPRENGRIPPTSERKPKNARLPTTNLTNALTIGGIGGLDSSCGRDCEWALTTTSGLNLGSGASVGDLRTKLARGLDSLSGSA